MTGSLQVRNDCVEIRSGSTDLTVAPVQNRDTHSCGQSLQLIMSMLSLKSRPRSMPKLIDCHVTDVHFGAAP